MAYQRKNLDDLYADSKNKRTISSNRQITADRASAQLDTTAYYNMLNGLLRSNALANLGKNQYQDSKALLNAATQLHNTRGIAQKYGIGGQNLDSYLYGVTRNALQQGDFMRQFTGQQDYNERYAYPQTVKGKTDAEIEAMIGTIPKTQNMLNRAAAFGKGTGSSGDDAYLKWLTDHFNNKTVTGLDRQIADNQSLLDANRAKQEELLTSAYVPENVGMTAADRKIREDYIAQYPNQERQEMEWTEMATGLAGWEEQKQIIEEMIKELQESGSFDQAKMDELQDSWLDAERHIHNLEEQMDAYTAPDEAERLAGQETHTYVGATPEQERLDALYYQYLDELDKDNRLKYETGPEQWAYDRDMQLSGLTSEQEKLDAQNAVLNAKREEAVARSKYNELTSAPDFTAKSAYDSDNQDRLYQYINAKGTSQEQGAAPVLGMGEYAGAIDVSAANDEAAYQAAGYTFLLPDEVQAYNYIYATEGEKEAKAFLDSFQNIRNLRARSKESEEWAKYADEHGVWSSVVSLGTNLASGLMYPLQAIDAKFNPNHSQFSPLYSSNYATQAIRGTVGQNVAEWAGHDLGNTVYQTLMSLGDFGVALAAGKGAGALAGSGFARGMTQFIMSSEAGSSTLLNNLQRGISTDKAVGMSVASAVIEALTEKYSIEALLKEPKKAAAYIAKNMLTEGSEEAASNLANTLVDLIVNADQAELAQAIAEKGYAQALTEYAQSVGMDAIMGALSGGIMGGGSVAVNKGMQSYHTAQTGKQINANQTYKQLHDIAVAMPEGSKARKIAQGKEKLNNRKAGQLYNALMEELDAKSQAGVRKSMVTDIKGRLQELGAQGDTTQVAEAIQKVWMGEKLSARESDLIAQSKLAMQVQHELLDLEEGWTEKAHETASKQRRETLTQMLDVERLASKGYKPAQDDAAAKAISKNASATYANADQEKGLNTKAYTKEGTTVEIKRIEEQDGKAVYLVEKDGQDVTYAINDLELDSINTENLVQPLKRGKMSAQAANTMMQLYATSGLSAPLYAKGFTVAYNAGVQRIGMAYVNNNSYSKALSPEVRKAAFDAGMADTKDEAPNVTKRKGRVTVDKSIDKANLTDGQKASIRAMEKIAKALHIDIEFFASKADATGSYAAYENGSFRDGVMRLDINAGRDKSTDVTEFAILRTASHEMTHYIAESSPQLYRELQAFVVDHLLEKGQSLQTLMDRKKARENRAMSDEAALEEVVADACEMMLKDSTAIETLARENATLFEKIADWLRDFFDKIREAFAGVEAVHSEARALMEADADGVMHYIDGLQALWDKALVDAARNVQGAQEAQGDARNIEKFLTREDAQFETHKFFESIVDKWNGETTGGRVLIGQFKNGGIYEGIGLPAGNLYMDFSKAANALEKHSDHIDKNVIKQIPHLLSRPVVITEPANRQVKNTVNVFGELLGTNGRPIMVSVVMTPDRTGSYLLNKVRTIEMRSDVDKLITEKLVLYLDGNKKRTTEWFQGLGNSSVPFAGTKWGFIRSIAYEYENGKGKLSSREVSALDAEYSRLYDEYRVAQVELMESERNYNEAAGSPELMDAMMALIDFDGSRFSPEGRTKYRELEAAIKQVEEKLRLRELREQKEAAAEKVKQIKAEMDEVDRRAALLKEHEAIKKSGLSEEDYFRKQAVKEFGYTSYFVDAGYLLPDGKMLNFSGEKGKHFGTRGQDHRAIGIVFETATGSAAMTRFMAGGNIRIMAESPGIDLINNTEPTTEQYAKIKSMVREYAEKRRFNVDISDESGRVIGSLFYEGKVNADKVVNDIKHYFATGEIREQSALDAFRYQARDSDTISSRDILANARPEDYRQSAAHGFLVDYQKAYQELERLADKLDKYQKAASAGNLDRDEQIKADNRVKLVQDQVLRQENKLHKMESKPEFTKVIAQERETFYNAVNSMTTNELNAKIKQLEAKYKTIETASAKELEDLELALEMNLGKKAAKELRIVNERNEKLKTENKTLRNEVNLTGKKIDFAVAEKELAMEMNLGHKREILRQMYESRIATLKSKNAQKLAAANQRGRERLEKYRDRVKDTQSRAALRDRIKHDVKELNRLLLNETDVKHVPEELKGAVAQFLTVFTQESSVFDHKKLDDLRYAYGKISDRNAANEDLPDISAQYDWDIANMMDDLREILPGKRLSELTQEETRKIRDIVQHFKFIVKESSRLFFFDKSRDIASAGQRFIEDTDQQKKYNGPDGAVANMLRGGMITPSYFFKKLGGVAKELFDDLKQGESTYGLRVAQARKFFDDVAKKYHYDDWRNVKDDVLTLNTQQGHTITLTREQALGLYATWNRENSDNGQSASHLSEGGFVYEEAMKKDKKTGKIEVDTSKPHKMTDADMLKVASWLTDEQRAYADAMVEYMSKDMAKLGNEVSMKLFGIEKYGEEKYYPYQTSKNYRYTALGAGDMTNDQRLKHSSFTHRVTQFANNPIIAADFTTVWANHVNHMLLYSSMCVPLENFNRVYNYKYTDEDGNHSVKQSLINAYGSAAQKYIEQLMHDLNGGVAVQSDGVMDQLISKFKKNAVYASASVAVQQPSAMVRAMALVNPKYFASGVMKDGSWDELTRYSGVAVIKEMGGFDTSTGFGAQDWITGERRKTKLETFSKKADDIASLLPERADRLAWVAIWKAVKAEVADSTGLEGEELLQAAAKRFDEVIGYTQVYDSTLSKSQMMRNKHLNAVTAFMAEPTVTYNLLVDAFFNRGKADSVNPARAVAAFTATAIVNALLKSLVTAARDDEEKNYLEKYAGEFVENVTSDLNPLNLIPYARDIVSIMQGYDVERADMSLISDLYKGVKRGIESAKDGDWYTMAKEFAGPISGLVGLPVKNVWRDIEAVFNAIHSIGTPMTPGGMKYSILEALPFYGSTPTDYYSRRLDAMLEGDASELESLTIHLETGLGKSAKTIKTQTKTQLGERYKAGKIGDAEATDILTDYFEMDADEAYWQLKEWREKEAHKGEDDYSFSRTDGLKEALLSGKTAQIEAAKTELAGLGGYTDKEVVSKAKSAIKSLYVDGQITFDKAVEMLNEQTDEYLNEEKGSKKRERQKKIENDLYWLEQEWEYAKVNKDNDDAEEWQKYGDLHSAIETGKGQKAAVKYLMDHGVTKSGIASSISGRWKEEYKKLYETDRKAALQLQSQILDAYVAAGYNRSEQAAYIRKNWLK